ATYAPPIHTWDAWVGTQKIQWAFAGFFLYAGWDCGAWPSSMFVNPSPPDGCGAGVEHRYKTFPVGFSVHPKQCLYWDFPQPSVPLSFKVPWSTGAKTRWNCWANGRTSHGIGGAILLEAALL